MRYEKPQVLSCAPADTVIAGSTDKSRAVAVDADPVFGETATHPAYEADE
ncbi:MAG TPA: hypothetical protein VI320_25560 [Terracidiphilus sp.]|jgi:hypothetical protein